MSNQQRPEWSNRLAFVLAAAGSAIGLGNIWKFPYITGVNGGGAFVLIYLFCIALVGIPIFLAELYIGQQSQTNAVSAFEKLHKQNTKWQIAGFFGILAAFLILSFYSVVGGWVLDFEFRSLLAEFNKPEDQIKETLSSLFANPLRQIFWHTVFMLFTILIVLKGVKEGLEKWNKILMPTLFIILVGLFIYVMFLPGFGQAMSFLFSPDFSKVTAASVLEAVGHSFFTLSLGMGAIITYGSFLSKSERIPRIALTVAFADTLIALTAGVVIFSIVFTFNMEPGAGPGLMFVSLPVLFSKIPGGYFVSVFFFLLVTFAAITSAVSILEVVVAYIEEKWKTNHKKTVWVVGFVAYLLGLLTVFSTNILAEATLFKKTFFDWFDLIASNYLLPLGGLLISLFLGWVVGQKAMEIVFPNGSKFLQKSLLVVLRIIAPIGVALVLLNTFVSNLFGKTLMDILGLQ